MSRLLIILCTLLLGANIAFSSGRPAPGPKPKGTDGAYNISVRGYYRGEGTATVTGNTISLTGTLHGEKGEQGDFAAPNLVISGNYVTGQGNILGQAVNIYGRLDPTGEGGGKKLKTARFVATVATADGHHIRIEGLLQSPPKSDAPRTPSGGGDDGDGPNDGPGPDHQNDRGHIVDDDDNGPSSDELP